LALAHHNIGAHGAGGLDRTQGDNLRADGDQQRSGGVCALGKAAQIVQVTIEIGRLHHDAGNPLIEQALQVLAARGRRRGDDDLIARHARHGLDGFPVVRMQVAGQHRTTPFAQPMRHQYRFGGGRRAVVHGSIGHFHVGEQGDLGLEFEQILQGALGDLGLVGGVGGQELGALNEVIDAGGHVMLIGTRPDKERHAARRRVLRCQAAHDALDLELTFPLGQVEQTREQLVLRHHRK
jgi:hypothetical protein